MPKGFWATYIEINRSGGGNEVGVVTKGDWGVGYNQNTLYEIL